MRCSLAPCDINAVVPELTHTIVYPARARLCHCNTTSRRFLQELLLADKNDLPERELSALEEILKYEVIKDAAKDSSLKVRVWVAHSLRLQPSSGHR